MPQTGLKLIEADERTGPGHCVADGPGVQGRTAEAV